MKKRQTEGLEIEVLHKSGNGDSKFRVWVEELTFPDNTASWRMRIVFPVLGSKGRIEEEERTVWAHSRDRAEQLWKCKELTPYYLHAVLSEDDWVWSPEDQAFLQPGQLLKRALRRDDGEL